MSVPTITETAGPTARDRGIPIVTGLDLPLSMKDHFIDVPPSEAGKSYVGFLSACSPCTGPTVMGDYDLSRCISASDYRRTPFILMPDLHGLGEIVTKRDKEGSSISGWEIARDEIQPSLEKLLREHGWTIYEGLALQRGDDMEPGDFENARQLVIQTQRDGRLAFMALPPGVYPLDFPERVASGALQMPKGAVDVLHFNRDHAFLRFESTGGRIHDHWVNYDGGRDNYVIFPGGRRQGPGNRYTTIRYAVRRSVEGVTIYLGRVYGAHLDYEGIIYADGNEALIRGRDSQQLKAMTDIVIAAYVKRDFGGSMVVAQAALAKKWEQDDTSLCLKIKRTSAAGIAKSLEARERQYGIKIRGFFDQNSGEKETTAPVLVETPPKPVPAGKEPYTPGHLDELAALYNPDQYVSPPRDGYAAGDNPYTNVNPAHFLAEAEYSEFEEKAMGKDDIFPGSWLRWLTDSRAIYTARILSDVDAEGYVLVLGHREHKEENTFFVGRLKLPAVGQPAEFSEFASFANPSDVQTVQYTDYEHHREYVKQEVLRAYEKHGDDWMHLSVVIKLSPPRHVLQPGTSTAVSVIEIGLAK